MSAKLYAHIRGNVVGYLALFFALSTGSAVALNGSNTVFSDDIVNDQVKTADVRNDTLSGGGLAAADLRPNSVGTSEVAGDSLGAADLASSSVGTSEIASGSLGTGAFASSIPAARVMNSADQSIADATATALSFDSERYDSAALHDTAVNNSRLTAPVTGIYEVTVNMLWDDSPTGSRVLRVLRNGASVLAVATHPTVGSTGQNLTTVARLAAGDYVEAYVSQDSGSALSVLESGDYSPEFSMTWLAPGP